MYIKIHNYNGINILFQPKWGLISLDTTLPPEGVFFTKVEAKVVSKGGKQAYIGFTTLAICGDETISSVPIEKNYNLKNEDYILSWDDSKRIVATYGGRLPTVDEVRHIIATKAGSSRWSESIFS